jgi:hypothetical protein
MNPTMAAIMGTFQIVWVYYGILAESRPVIVWNTIAVAINFLVVEDAHASRTNNVVGALSRVPVGMQRLQGADRP